MCHFLNFHVFINEFAIFLQKHEIWEINIFIFFVISPELFDLQKCTIRHFNPWNISIWPIEVHFVRKCYGFWARKPQSCLLFFCSPSRIAQINRPTYMLCIFIQITKKIHSLLNTFSMISNPIFNLHSLPYKLKNL